MELDHELVGSNQKLVVSLSIHPYPNVIPTRSQSELSEPFQNNNYLLFRGEKNLPTTQEAVHTSVPPEPQTKYCLCGMRLHLPMEAIGGSCTPAKERTKKQEHRSASLPYLCFAPKWSDSGCSGFGEMVQGAGGSTRA